MVALHHCACRMGLGGLRTHAGIQTRMCSASHGHSVSGCGSQLDSQSRLTHSPASSWPEPHQHLPLQDCKHEMNDVAIR